MTMLVIVLFLYSLVTMTTCVHRTLQSDQSGLRNLPTTHFPGNGNPGFRSQQITGNQLGGTFINGNLPFRNPVNANTGTPSFAQLVQRMRNGGYGSTRAPKKAALQNTWTHRAGHEAPHEHHHNVPVSLFYF